MGNLMYTLELTYDCLNVISEMYGRFGNLKWLEARNRNLTILWCYLKSRLQSYEEKIIIIKSRGTLGTLVQQIINDRKRWETKGQSICSTNAWNCCELPLMAKGLLLWSSKLFVLCFKYRLSEITVLLFKKTRWIIQ